MKQFIKDYFSFNRRERNGILLLLGIIIILILYLNLSEYFVTTQKIDFSGFEKEIDEFLAAQPPTPSKSFGYTQEGGKYLRDGSSRQFVSGPGEGLLFPFNPNNLSEEEWRQLGLKDWQIKAIEKYKSKAGDFHTKEDFKKLHVISEEQYHILEPYIQLPEEGNEFATNFRDGKRISQKQSTDVTIKQNKSWRSAGSLYDKSKIEINSADTFELKRIKGIGSVYANRIIKYRNLLGGFFKKEQLLEVYGIDASVYEPISKFIEVDASKIRKININFCSIYQLKQHPYIKWNVANAIVNYRDRHEKYAKLADIRKTDLVNDELYLKIAPYLTIE